MTSTTPPTTTRPTRPAARTASARPKRAAAGAPRVPFAVLLVALVVGGMALLLILNTASAANEVSRHSYAEQDSSVSAQVQGLQNEVAAKSAPANLAQAAAALGMVPAGNPAFLVVGADGKVTIRGKAAPASQVVVAVPKADTKKKTTAKKTTKKTAKKSTKTAKKSTDKKTSKTLTKKTTTKSPAKRTTTKSPAKKKTTGTTRTGGTR